MEPDTLAESAIVDTITAIFAAPEFERGWRQSLWEQLLDWLSGGFLWFRGLARTAPGLYWASIILLVMVLVLVAARIGMLIRARRIRSAALAAEKRAGRRAVGLRDPWVVAQEEAARGNFTDAAHALYLALLDALARREQVRLHPAKTIGDYVRELRARSSSLFGAFREFARTYEVVVYGIGTCDRDRYERLRELALPIVQAA
ncbi:MAG TPA: DUF4129 domain-containing protein [Gemmatimonadaceae bacterium]|nr:DUF4129 domain-containing protein [Gemmatimonadaceae bacterium]